MRAGLYGRGAVLLLAAQLVWTYEQGEQITLYANKVGPPRMGGRRAQGPARAQLWCLSTHCPARAWSRLLSSPALSPRAGRPVRQPFGALSVLFPAILPAQGA